MTVRRGVLCPWKYDDGGREDAGYTGSAGDCVTRAIAIVTGRPYSDVYGELFAAQREFGKGRSRAAARAAKYPSPRNGVYKLVYQKWLDEAGLVWTPTMSIGSGCQVHLRPDELPSGRIIVRLSKHFAAVIDGVLHDTYDCSRGGTRCVYGYWSDSKGEDQC